ncbi:flagellar type III secretion system pore protein FliP [Roseburia sp. 499]|uniref:flagellar type III secretion system pore protein FliP n=1 Tax=Roseburia sp. 499 TaxID=1261634 RepID=UPI000952FB54|nr:flagellar type III secretion system pore protein FliP [Roseburia sp. 499]WVK71228.1 flagellar type III secretion system pore protein FliP [Roseburia sp. 499]
MKKLKKIYCGTSFAFGTITLILALVLCLGQNAYATEANQDLTEQTTNEVGQLDSGTQSQVQGATTDNTNGVHVTWNNEDGDFSGNLKILLVLTVISLAPSILIMLTSFTRIIIVLHFVRNAIGTQTAPPNQVLIGLALFLTLFIMNPVFTEINENAIKPFDAGEITQEQAIEEGEKPLRRFMYKETQQKDLNLFCDIAGIDDIDTSDEEQVNQLSMTIIIPSFILSELRTAFIMGFLIYVPFIVIDMVVASVLMSMGMMMLPPTTISLPFKVLLFVLADGWDLVIGSLVKTFY